MSKMSKIDQIHIRAVMLCMLKMSKILKQTITDFLEFISLLLGMLKMCMNYNVDSNMNLRITVKFDLNP